MHPYGPSMKSCGMREASNLAGSTEVNGSSRATTRVRTRHIVYHIVEMNVDKNAALLKAPVAGAPPLMQLSRMGPF